MNDKINFNELSLDEINEMIQQIKLLEDGSDMNQEWLIVSKFRISGYSSFINFKHDLLCIASERMKDSISVLLRHRPYDFIK